MELVVRLHRLHRATGTRYRIVFVPDPICWTEAPESLRVLRSQRTRWQRGLAESLTLNLGLAFSRRGGAPGWFAFPFMALFEWLGPLIEVAGYAFMLAGLATGLVSGAAFAAFLLLAIGLGVALSVCALLLEEISFHIYKRPRELAVLAAAALLENFGFRQLVALWRLEGLLRWASGSRARWGEMTRSAGWQKGG
jgi:cellulose synthase/poly-beta-1,6-N-acetylglucosamine synthase-like glycosyltransferase